ncbi:alpha/beta hydrolase family protein [Methyloversatilis sp. RAC08]|uniref:alpha/beta fold hydrolase n=1 Tax=Methyloversatilis sp. RAC08 TaxID=1842540 RepID=UPI00083E39DB|nr:alpha/beta hydrolase [Methyloversatilis sp. RAC08]AOF81133.1 alpha/beta hydrolase family protein [Methyloversatilis sp. RAC08]
MQLNHLIAAAGAAGAIATGAVQAADYRAAATPPVTFHYAQVDNVKVFYRQAGNPAAPTVLLLHGFPTSSFMYRDLIPMLAKRYNVIAPDMPGFGLTQAPEQGKYTYTFDQLAKTMEGFTNVLGLERYALQVFDYGAPVGWRLAAARPERVTALISQNGNAYEVGLAEGWIPIQRYWKDPSPANREAVRQFVTPEAIKWQYTHGVKDLSRVAPDSYLLDAALTARPGNVDIQLDLFLDYADNVAQYPQFQAYFRKHRPPVLAVWGKNDPFFLNEGAEAFKRDVPDAEVRFFDTGHFALETHVHEIGPVILDFLDRKVARTR